MKALLWTTLLSLLLLTGCGDTKEVVTQEVSDPEVLTLVQGADELKFQIETSRILRSAALRDRQKVEALIDIVKGNSILLGRNAADTNALTGLATAISEFETVMISERDKPRINEVMQIGRNILVRYADLNGFSLDGYQWLLYSYRFSSSVGNFGSSDIPIEWEVRPIQNERYAISARGTNKTAVLLTPTFDLTNAENPSYQIRHSLRVEEAFPPKDEFNESKIRNVAFRVYVSTSFKDGETPDFRNREKWQRVSLGKQPTGRDFHLIDSGLISLKEFKGKKVTMAFVYKNDNSIDNHSLNWAIERFELYGAAKEINVQSRPTPFNPAAQNRIGKKIWKHDFPKKKLEGLEQVTLSGTPNDFVMGEHRGNAFVLMDSFQKPGTKLLSTVDPIDLSEVLNPYIRIKHTINRSSREFQENNYVSLVVAEHEEGKEAKDLNWQVIDFEYDTPGDSWTVFTTEFVALPEALKGKKVRVGWRHTAEGSTYPTWQFYEADLRDIKPEEL